MIESWKHIFFLFPVMGYYLLESIVAAIFVNAVWQFVLQDFTGIKINYIKWVAIIWIIKVLLFDVFKLLSGFTQYNNTNDNQENQ
jgi:hypothetical protein